MSGIPSSGPVPVHGVVGIWSLSPGPGPNPVGTELRLAPGKYTPSSQTFPASATSNFPLSKFLGVSLTFVTSFTTPNPVSPYSTTWTSPITGNIRVLVVAGGGGGDWGGGGAGGVIYNTSFPVTAGTPYPITVGNGGPGYVSPSSLAQPGGPSIFSSITATGGGAGGGQPSGSGYPGGSGGGAGFTPSSTATGIPGQGNPGGVVFPGPGQQSSAGGGGAGQAGTPGGTGNGGSGGNGIPINITGTAIYYGGGGGGLGFSTLPSARPGGAGGLGGGGTGGEYTTTQSVLLPGTPGTNGLGGGGGGAREVPGSVPAPGGSGVVILAYP